MKAPMAPTSAWFSKPSGKTSSALSSVINEKAFHSISFAKLQSRSFLVSNICTVVGSFTQVRTAIFTPLFLPSSPLPITDIKPQNILVCIDDVEAVIQKELTTASADGDPPRPPTEPVGVRRSHSSSMPLRPKSEAVDRITIKIADFCSGAHSFSAIVSNFTY